MQIFEKSHFTNEIGAAITVTPNGMRVLDRWGFDSEKAGGIDGQQVQLVNPHSLEPVHVESFRELETEFGHKMKYFHRADLHSGLKEMAESQGRGLEPPVSIRLGDGVAEVDCEKGIIFLENGRQIQKDLVIIADGIWVSICNGGLYLKTFTKHPNSQVTQAK